MAASGEVTPAARAAFAGALAGDGADPRARYFLAMALACTPPILRRSGR
ncbi:MAG TPA: hypothetical protein VII63_09785 [Caulobacteraceae bacterium]